MTPHNNVSPFAATTSSLVQAPPRRRALGVQFRGGGDTETLVETSISDGKCLTIINVISYPCISFIFRCKEIYIILGGKQ
ncbi:MAG: hypothetical protein K0S71_2619 [Clostridia bacterium]|nr:hypothetical protein [Clostridia bacterium]